MTVQWREVPPSTTPCVPLSGPISDPSRTEQPIAWLLMQRIEFQYHGFIKKGHVTCEPKRFMTILHDFLDQPKFKTASRSVQSVTFIALRFTLGIFSMTWCQPYKVFKSANCAKFLLTTSCAFLGEHDMDIGGFTVLPIPSLQSKSRGATCSSPVTVVKSPHRAWRRHRRCRPGSRKSHNLRLSSGAELSFVELHSRFLEQISHA